MADPKQEAIEVIHSWSAPRSLSTSLMYSFSQGLQDLVFWNMPSSLFEWLMLIDHETFGSHSLRDDIEVLDEPLYGTFLRVTGVERPYREDVLSKMECDGNKVVDNIIYGPGKNRYRYCKHIAKQRVPGLPNDLLQKGKHFILIQNPLNILSSFEKVVPPSFLELGLGDLVSIYSELCALGKPPPVIDAADLQQNPEDTLRGLCKDLDIPFHDAMLRHNALGGLYLHVHVQMCLRLGWEAGPKPIDGLWAPWWYKSVHNSTHFASPRKYPRPFPFSFYDLLEQSLPFYNLLKRNVRQTSSLLRSPLPVPDLPVPENAKLLAWVGDEIVPRESAKVSVFDSVVQGGDAVWEGLRIYNRKIFKLEEHLDRMFDSAKALAFINVPTRDQIKEAIFRTLNANGMFDNTHIRLTLTRGKKVTSGMSPSFNRYGCTLIEYAIVVYLHNISNIPFISRECAVVICGFSADVLNVSCGKNAVLPEWKPPVYDNESGIKLVTATTRRNSPNNLDSKIHHNNLLNNILAKVVSNAGLSFDFTIKLR
ncbi:hypothetical protein Golob_000897, partial [Gossypium lobatum]|nr:hypothetical protein [Gossypium lobatum]